MGIIRQIRSGNVSWFCEEILKKSSSCKDLYSLLADWCVLAFDQMLCSEYSLVDDTLCNSIGFLCAAWADDKFVSSEAFAKFQNHLSIDKLKELVGLAISKSRSETACCVHRAISTLIASKELSSVSVPTTTNSNFLQPDASEVSESSLYQSGKLQALADWREEEESEESDADVSSGDEGEHSEYHDQDVACESSFNS